MNITEKSLQLNEQLKRFGLIGTCQYTRNPTTQQIKKNRLVTIELNKIVGLGRCELSYKKDIIAYSIFTVYMDNGKKSAILEMVEKEEKSFKAYAEEIQTKGLTPPQVGKFVIFKFILLLALLGVEKVVINVMEMGTTGKLFKYYIGLGFKCLKPIGEIHESNWVPRESSDKWYSPTPASIGEKDYNDSIPWYHNCYYMQGFVRELLQHCCS